jgi:hypothetical protein
MAELSFPSWDQILNVVDSKDLGEDGLEKEPHVTVLYGIEPNVKLIDIVKIVQDWLKPTIILGQFGVFEREDFDVLFLQVESFDIGVCRELAKVLPNYQSFPHYSPHLTVAYLKSGTGKKYLDIPIQIPFSAYEVSHFNISMASGKSQDVPPKFVILNYQSYLKHISNKEFLQMNVEKTGQIATLVNSAFISGHAYNRNNADMLDNTNRNEDDSEQE